MLAVTCDKCRRRYTETDEELQVYLNQAEGKKFAQILCPHCGKASKVAIDRIHQALRFTPIAADAEAPSTSAPAETPAQPRDTDSSLTTGAEQSSKSARAQTPVEPGWAETLPTADWEQAPPNITE